MTLEILPSAQEELEQAFLYYESQVPGLGSQFLAAVAESYRRILLNPRAWTVLKGRRFDFHRCLMNRFPYGIIYRRNEGALVVVAIMHLSRKPYYWNKRR